MRVNEYTRSGGALLRFRRRLYYQLSFGFIVLLVLCCTIFVLVLTYSLPFLRQQAEQLVRRDTAVLLAAELQPALSPTISLPKILEAQARLDRYDKFASLLFVDEHGKAYNFLGTDIRSDNAIDVALIEEYLNDNSWAPNRRAIQSPYFSGEATFSAARVQILGKPGYLLYTFGSERISAIETFVHADAALKSTVLFAGTLTLIAAALGLTLFSVLTKKFYRILDVVESFRIGDYSRRCTITANNELGILADSINAMADTIEQNIIELEQKDELRRRLVANISHDLRSPIGGIVTLADALLMHSDSLSSEQLEARLEGLVSSGLNVTRLVDELFELSKFEAREVRAELTSLSVERLLTNARNRAFGKAEQRELQLEIELSEPLPAILGDEALLDRVLDNLIGNAIRHSRTNDTITLGAELEDSKIKISVRDTGEGIAEEEITQITKAHFQSSKSTKTGGMGLGLAIVTEVLALHESRLRIESKLGAGSSFSFLLATANEG